MRETTALPMRTMVTLLQPAEVRAVARACSSGSLQ